MNDTGKQASHRLAPGKSLVDAQQQLEEDGYLLVEGLCDLRFVAHLLEVSLGRSDQVISALGTQPIGIGSAAGFDEVVQRSPGRWDIPISPDEFGVDDRTLPWWPLIAAVLGDEWISWWICDRQTQWKICVLFLGRGGASSAGLARQAATWTALSWRSQSE